MGKTGQTHHVYQFTRPQETVVLFFHDGSFDEAVVTGVVTLQVPNHRGANDGLIKDSVPLAIRLRIHLYSY